MENEFGLKELYDLSLKVTYPIEMVDVTERDGKCPIIKLR